MDTETEYELVKDRMTGKDWLMLILLKIEDEKHRKYRIKYNQKPPILDSYRSIYIARYLQDKSVKEIANSTGISQTRIYQILRRIDKISNKAGKTT